MKADHLQQRSNFPPLQTREKKKIFKYTPLLALGERFPSEMGREEFHLNRFRFLASTI